MATDARDGHQDWGHANGSTQPAPYPGPVEEPEAPTPALQPGRGLLFGAIGFLVAVVGGAIAGGIALAASGADDFDALNLGWLAVAQSGLWLGLLGAPYVAALVSGSDMRRAYGLSVHRSDLLVGGLAGLIGQFAILWLVFVPMSLLSDVSQEELSEPAQNLTDKATGPLGVVLLVLIVGIGAPIVEEIFYRGLLQRSFVRLVGAPVGIGLTALLFGAAHIQLLQLPALALAGLLFGVLAHRYGRLGPAIAAHVVFNMTAVVTLLATT